MPERYLAIESDCLVRGIEIHHLLVRVVSLSDFCDMAAMMGASMTILRTCRWMMAPMT